MSGGNKNLNEKISFTESFLISGIVACFSKTVSAPLERVKLLMQSQDELLKKKILLTKYDGVKDCINRTYKQEGGLAFWRGNWANCVRYFPTQALSFSFKKIINEKKQFKVTSKDGFSKKLFKNIMAGGLAGSGSLVFVYSLDYCRTRLGNDAPDAVTGKRKYTGLVDVYKKTYATDGLFGLYRGFCFSCMGIFIYRGFYFGLYDTAKPILLADNNSFVKSFILGYCVTVFAEIVAYPCDTVRRRMMMTSGEAVKYKSGFDCLFIILKNEGFPSLMKGSVANILRGVGAALVLAGYDKVIEWYLRLSGRA